MKNLIKVAEELNDKMGLDPEIKTKGVDVKKLKKELVKAAEMIDWDADDISVETAEELAELGVEVPADVLPEADEPEADDVEDLVTLIDKTTKLKALKALVKDHDVFKPLRKKLVASFDVAELKEDMMELLGVKTAPAAAPEKPKAAAKPKTADKPKAAAVVSDKTRIDCSIEVFKSYDSGDTLIVPEWVKQSDELFMNEKKVVSNLKESRYNVNKAIQVMSALGIIEVVDKDSILKK